MRISDMNWMQVKDHIDALAARNVADRIAALPIGSTEQHAYLSLSVDSILSERVAVEAAEGVDVVVFPALPYGLTPGFVDYPGTVTLRAATLSSLLEDVLTGIVRAGFNRIVIVNGHGGNRPGHGAVMQWLDTHRGIQVKWHDWYNAPRTWAEVQRIDPVASHASWMENFPITRVADARQPAVAKPMVDLERIAQLDPGARKAVLGDGNFGGLYQRTDDDMARLWRVAVEETRAVLVDGWV